MVAESEAKKRQAQRFGRWGEWLCRASLFLTGWRIVKYGFKSHRGTGAGEVDLIAQRGRVLAFIEVKARPDLKTGLFAISAEQQERITKGAERFLATNPHLQDMDVRFDVMIVRPWRWPLRISDAWRD